jgi:DNA-binding response OmpR family regulator
VIVLTAEASSSRPELIRRFAVAEYLTKPLDIKEFVEAIGACLRRRRP